MSTDILIKAGLNKNLSALVKRLRIDGSVAKIVVRKEKRRGLLLLPRSRY